jgi:hypothetical protein
MALSSAAQPAGLRATRQDNFMAGNFSRSSRRPHPTSALIGIKTLQAPLGLRTTADVQEGLHRHGVTLARRSSRSDCAKLVPESMDQPCFVVGDCLRPCRYASTWYSLARPLETENSSCYDSHSAIAIKEGVAWIRSCGTKWLDCGDLQFWSSLRIAGTGNNRPLPGLRGHPDRRMDPAQGFGGGHRRTATNRGYRDRQASGRAGILVTRLLRGRAFGKE